MWVRGGGCAAWGVVVAPPRRLAVPQTRARALSQRAAGPHAATSPANAASRDRQNRARSPPLPPPPKKSLAEGWRPLHPRGPATRPSRHVADSAELGPRHKKREHDDGDAGDKTQKNIESETRQHALPLPCPDLPELSATRTGPEVGNNQPAEVVAGEQPGGRLVGAIRCDGPRMPARVPKPAPRPRRARDQPAAFVGRPAGVWRGAPGAPLEQGAPHDTGPSADRVMEKARARKRGQSRIAPAHKSRVGSARKVCEQYASPCSCACAKGGWPRPAARATEKIYS